MVKLSIFPQFKADTLFQSPVLLFLDAKLISNVVSGILKSSLGHITNERTHQNRKDHSERSYKLFIRKDYLQKAIHSVQLGQVEVLRMTRSIIASKT
ncbi:MAG: hypothetical protein COT84_02565 [Chlamydiae bacterium CG10_big_fil_rev_8_21_14_0_10_35_9]|nr:MAG: hypothetical protein COT84_02565 [Chlamydiae bacterium CG10_big_fil_rev_8_21_14_0_10_35_9]